MDEKLEQLQEKVSKEWNKLLEEACEPLGIEIPSI
jgi:hypothetical protein